MDQTLKERKLRADAQDKPLKYVQKLEKPAQRPPTPRLPTPREDDDDIEQAALLLQKLIRGRVIQNRMYLGKERRLTLINELRTRHSLQRNADTMETPDDDEIKDDAEDKVSESLGNGRKEDLNGKDAQRRTLSLRAAELLPIPGGEATQDDNCANVTCSKLVAKDEILTNPLVQKEHVADEEALEQVPTLHQLESFFESSIQAEYIGKRFDFLTKELVRLREERRIAAMVRYAERTRRMREADESGAQLDICRWFTFQSLGLCDTYTTGLRQAELKRREQEDVIFKQMSQAHQETVDSYLEDVILNATEKTSDIQSRKEVNDYAVKLNEIVQSLHDDDTVVADLVTAFLIPEVEREMLREQGTPIVWMTWSISHTRSVKLSESKYLMAAHKALYDAEVTVEETVLSTGTAPGTDTPGEAP
jgi:hypothetical protein